jgi:hypothetical protein
VVGAITNPESTDAVSSLQYYRQNSGRWRSESALSCSNGLHGLDKPPLDLKGRAVKSESGFHCSQLSFQVGSRLESTWFFVHELCCKQLALCLESLEVLAQCSIHRSYLMQTSIAMLGLREELQKFLYTKDVEVRWRCVALESCAHGTSGIEQLELNLMILSPTLEEDQHAQPAALESVCF